jgi:hypothetical protein
MISRFCVATSVLQKAKTNLENCQLHEYNATWTLVRFQARVESEGIDLLEFIPRFQTNDLPKQPRIE